MNLSELNHEETVVLLGFMRVIIQADGEFTESERVHVANVRDTLGLERFQTAMHEATQRFDTNDALKDATKAIARPEAREVIHALLVEVAEADSVTPEEEKPLRWIESWWSLPRNGA